MRQRRSARSPSTRRPSDRASTDRLPIGRQRTDLESPPASEAVGSAQEVAFRERQVDHALRDNRSKLQSPRQHDGANRLVITPGREHVVVAERPGQPSACVFHSNGSAIAGSRTQRLDSRARRRRRLTGCTDSQRGEHPVLTRIETVAAIGRLRLGLRRAGLFGADARGSGSLSYPLGRRNRVTATYLQQFESNQIPVDAVAADSPTLLTTLGLSPNATK